MINWELDSALQEACINAPQWLQMWRANHLQSFLQNGFPTRRQEDWKYTQLTDLQNRNFVYTTQINKTTVTGIDNYKLPNTHCLVFVDGNYSSELSNINALPTRVILSNLATCLKKKYIKQHLTISHTAWQTVFARLNAGLFEDGLYLYVPHGVIVKEPIHVIYVSTIRETEWMHHPRHIIIAEENAAAVVFEEYIGYCNTVYFNNVVTHIEAKANSNIKYYKLQRESKRAFHVANITIHQDKNSNVQTHHIATGGQLSRDDLRFALQGTGASCHLLGFYFTQKRQHIDNHTRIDHYVSHCVSEQNYKGILKGNSRAVFNGKILVHPYAQHTSAQQLNRNLLLSKSAEIDTKPELEIYANDVQCTHAATVGQLDEDVLFYLRSRGIDKISAQHLLTHAFTKEVLDRLPDKQIATHVEEFIKAELD